MIEKVLEEFNKYTANYDKTDKNISVKYNHSFAVMEIITELSFRLGLDSEKMELARVIGLLHDIGRFEQLKQFKSFNDNNMDHAEVGADYLFKEGNIRNYLDTDKYDSIIEKAIRYHNKLTIPSDLTSDEEFFCKLIRDADKIDILKQEAINYELNFDAKEITSEVLEDIKEGRLVNRNNVHSNSDDTIQSLSMIFDINFEETFDLLVETDNFDLFLSMINISEDSENLFKKVKEICFDKINRGIGD